ncbi:TolC family protein [Catalinimonas niigatensis]|uniref:TolC family protein n=1 Tax=Catalinimonas niigatensis TaxID=1397264 RepID=UPI002665864E|nr:TolC family protein [Catalinimonas niigatensis]WPP49462.1 TolC family protein [Catalinimonas niigatensis]
MILKKLIHNSFYFICFLGLISSCKLVESPQMPQTAELPSSFAESTDTISMGDLIWEDFFNDPHLVGLIDTALENNLDLLKALQRIEVARANFQIRKGALLPSLDIRFRARTGNVKENLLDNTINGENVANQTQNYFFGLQSSWEADIWGKLRNRREAAYARYLATEKGKHLVTTSLVAEVARLYYELLGLDNELETLEKNIDFQEIALEMIKIQKVGGRATELAVQQFEAQLLRTKSLGFEKRQRIIEVENELNLLLGRYPQPIERGESILEQRLPEVVRAGVPSDMLLRRPDIQQAELELVAAKADVEAARAEFLPSFVIVPYAGFNTTNLPSLLSMPESLTLGLIGGITAPILNKNRIRSDYNQSVARNLENFYSYQQTVLTGYQEVVSSLRRVENLTKVYELREQETVVLSNAISTSNDLFAAGYATYLEVITAQARALEAELSMTTTRKEIFVSLIELYRALGGGWQ